MITHQLLIEYTFLTNIEDSRGFALLFSCLKSVLFGLRKNVVFLVSYFCLFSLLLVRQALGKKPENEAHYLWSQDLQSVSHFPNERAVAFNMTITGVSGLDTVRSLH